MKTIKTTTLKTPKKLKIVTAALVLTMSMGLMAGCGAKAQDQGASKEAPKTEQKAELLKVGIVQSMSHGSLDQARQGFVDGLKASGYEEGKNITLDVQNAESDQSNLQTIVQRFMTNKVDLICAIATNSAQIAAQATTEKKIPVVATAVTDYVKASLVESNEKPGMNVTGTSDMVPIEEQIDLLLKFAPEAKTLGVIYTSSEINSETQAEIMEAYVKSLGLKVEKATVTNVNDIQQAAQGLVGKVDAIYVPTDNIMASSIPALAKVTDEAKLPMVCGATSMVEAGGLATLGIDYYKLGLQTGEMAAKILKGEAKPEDMAIQTSKEMDLVINQEVADRLGITIAQDILDKKPKLVSTTLEK